MACPAEMLLAGCPGCQDLLPQFVPLTPCTICRQKLSIAPTRFKAFLGTVLGDGHLAKSLAALTRGAFQLSTAKKAHCELVFNVLLPLERAGIVASPQIPARHLIYRWVYRNYNDHQDKGRRSDRPQFTVCADHFRVISILPLHLTFP